MKIVGGNGQGTDNEKTRIIEIEDGDVDRHISVYAQVREGGGVDLWPGYQGDKEALDDPVERGENLSPPFWVAPESWEYSYSLSALAEFVRLGMVDIVASAALQGLVITLWGCEARKRLALNLLEMAL